MNLAWKTDLPHADKLVLLALADNANDEGLCWPSVQTLERKCGMSESTVHRAISRLEEGGHVTVNQRPGRSSYYTVHPRQDDTPVTVTPPSQRHPTPVKVTPHPCHSDTHNHQGTIKEPGSSRAKSATRIPEELVLTDEMRGYALKKGITAVDETFEAFCDYWRAESGAKARKHDWLAAWRTWCRRTLTERAKVPQRFAPDPPTARPKPPECKHGLDRSRCVYCRNESRPQP